MDLVGYEICSLRLQVSVEWYLAWAALAREPDSRCSANGGFKNVIYLDHLSMDLQNVVRIEMRAIVVLSQACQGLLCGVTSTSTRPSTTETWSPPEDIHERPR